MAEPDPSRLIAALADIERYVTSNGWDQPARLFGLVTTGALLELEPQLRGRIPDSAPDALTAIEQDEFAVGDDLFKRLEGIAWPASIEGCAIALERSFLSPEYEEQIPTDPEAAVDFVAKHDARIDVRVVVGALRDGSQHGLARLVSNPDELLGSEDLVPGLADALRATLEVAV